jgi:hypothetical protein
MEPMKPTTSETPADDAAKKTDTAYHHQADDSPDARRAETASSGGREGGQSGSDYQGADTSQSPDARRSDGAGPENCATEEDGLAADWRELSFSVARALRYHAKRRAFFERCNQLTRALSAIFGAGTVAAVVKGIPWITGTMGAMVGIATALDLVFDFSRRAMIFDDLYRRFADLSVEIVSAEPSHEAVRRITIKKLLIEKEEPTLLSILNVVCSNEERVARGYTDVYGLTFWQERLCQFWDIGPFKFELVPVSPSRG